MPPKRPLPSKDLPSASSSDEEESSGASHDEEIEEEKEEGREFGESESKSESDEEDDKRRQKKSQPKPSSAPPPQQQQKSQGASSTESESESESEAESESESRRNTIASKFETPPAKKQKPESQPSAKRKVSKEPKESKRGKKKKEVAENGSLQKSGQESKKPMFQRIWSGNDEIAFLQGMVDFREKEGMDPFANTDAFYRYVKRLLGQEFTDNQLANKIRALKKKYTINERKDSAFAKPHEQNVFELSKKIWGDAGGIGQQTPTAKRGNKTAPTSKDITALIPSEHGDSCDEMLLQISRTDSCDEMLLQISRTGLDRDFLKKGWEVVDESSKEEWKERWRKLRLTEMRALAERTALIGDRTNLILKAYERAAVPLLDS